MSLLPFLHRTAAGSNLSSDLSEEEAYLAMGILLEGASSEAVVAAFLVALKMKGETAPELAGFARAMRERMIVVDAGADVVDTCGTGGDAVGTFNISTAAALVMAGAGAHVAKHGNRSFAGSSGSADVLEALAVRIAMTADEAAWAIREIGIAFLFAPHLHPAMKLVGPVRRELKMRTVFNLLGPLANPAQARRQLIGAPSPAAARLMAEALAPSELFPPLSFTDTTAWTKSAPPVPPMCGRSLRQASKDISGRLPISACAGLRWTTSPAAILSSTRV